MSDRLLSLQEVADLLNVSEDTVKRAAIPFTRIGRQRRYHPRIIQKYQADHASRPAAWKEGVAA